MWSEAGPVCYSRGMSVDLKDKLIDVAGWVAVVVFTASLVGLLLGGPPWLLAVTVAAAIAIVLLTATDADDQGMEDDSYGQDHC